MKKFKIKNKYRGITIPYYYSDYKKDIFGYIYKDNLYQDRDLYNLFEDFLGLYLTYHIKANGKLVTVHSLEEVAELLLNNYESFEIPSKYKTDFSDREYDQFIKVQNYLVNNKKPKAIDVSNINIKEKNIFKRFKNYIQDFRWNRLIKEMQQYKNEIPIKVYSKSYKRFFYVVDGRPYWTLLSAFEEVYNIGFYYQYCGDGIDEYSDHLHSHNFEYVIREVMQCPSEFKIYDFQKKFYSDQELRFLNALAQKLFSFSKERDTSYYYDGMYYGPLAKKYYEYRDKKNYFMCFIYNRKIQKIIKSKRKQNLKNHKI